MAFTFKMVKKMFLHTYFIPFIFPVITFTIVSSKTEFISGFPYKLVTTALTSLKIDQTVIITI